MQTAEEDIFDSQQYLVWEKQQQQKHEFIRGEVFAMGGARREHVLVSLKAESPVFSTLLSILIHHKAYWFASIYKQS